MTTTTTARLLATYFLMVCATVGAHAEEHHTFWEVKGRHNTVYLLGSVHMLKPADSALPGEAVRAYAHSKALVMELDFNNLPKNRLRNSDLSLEMLPADQTLEQVLGPELYAQFLAHAQPLGLQPATAAHVQPWFAALLLEQSQLAKSGFDTDAGVDEQFARRAKTDHKLIIGLETVDEQLGFFSHLTLAQQCQYLRSTMEELDTDAGQTDEVVRAWQRGDTVALAQILSEDWNDSPELFRVLTTDRNRKWLPRITQLLNEKGRGNYLVIVGALHLIGPDGLIELLRAQGYTAIQR